MRPYYPLIFLALAACDSSTGSRPNPVAPIAPIPDAQAVAGANTSGSSPGALSTPQVTPPASPNEAGVPTQPSAEVVSPADSSALKLGLTTNRIDMLKRLGNDMALKAQDFRVAAEGLKVATAEYCAATSEQDLGRAQASWRSVMDVWQYFEVFQIGPVSEGSKVLKFNIYAWPDPANYCRIDEEALKSSKSASYKLPPNYNRKGLQAVEYLLFDESYATRCSAGSASANEWNALPLEAKTQTRCTYLTALTSEIANQGVNLENRWGTKDNNYISQSLSDPAKVNDLVQALYEAAYYVDLEVKNQKLGGPAGLDTRYCDKSPEPCLAKAEFALSGYSRQAVNVNLAALVDIIYGSSNSGRAGGLSALVRAEGNGQGDAVAERSEKLVAGLAQTFQSESDSGLDELVTAFAKENCDVSSSSWICKTRNGLRQIFTDFKGEYASILKVKAPAAAAGDND